MRSHQFHLDFIPNAVLLVALIAFSCEILQEANCDLRAITSECDNQILLLVQFDYCFLEPTLDARVSALFAGLFLGLRIFGFLDCIETLAEVHNLFLSVNVQHNAV